MILISKETTASITVTWDALNKIVSSSTSSSKSIGAKNVELLWKPDMSNVDSPLSENATDVESRDNIRSTLFSDMQFLTTLFESD